MANDNRKRQLEPIAPTPALPGAAGTAISGTVGAAPIQQPEALAQQQQAPGFFSPTELGLLVQGLGVLGQDPFAQQFGQNLLSLGAKLQEQQAIAQREAAKLKFKELKLEKEQEAAGLSSQSLLSTIDSLQAKGLLDSTQALTGRGLVAAGKTKEAAKMLSFAANTPKKQEILAEQVKIRSLARPDLLDKLNQKIKQKKFNPLDPTTPKKLAALLETDTKTAKGLIAQLREDEKILPESTMGDTANAALEFMGVDFRFSTGQQQFLRQRAAQAAAPAGQVTTPPIQPQNPPAAFSTQPEAQGQLTTRDLVPSQPVQQIPGLSTGAQAAEAGTPAQPAARTQPVSRNDSFVPAQARQLPQGSKFRISNQPDMVFILRD